MTLARIDVDQDKLIAAQFRIQSMPTVYALFQGQPVADLTQYRSEGQIKQRLDQLLAQLPSGGEAQELQAEIEPLLAMGEKVLEEGDAAARSDHLPARCATWRPMTRRRPAALARALSPTGKADEARALLDRPRRRQAKHAAIARARAVLEVAAAPPADVSAEEERLAADPDDHEARFAIANARMAAGDRDAAAEAASRDHRPRQRVERGRGPQAASCNCSRRPGLEDPWARAQRRRLSAVLFT